MTGRIARLLAVLTLGVAVLLLARGATSQPQVAARIITSDVAAPAIDTGLVARGSAEVRSGVTARERGRRAGEPIPGLIIVKYRDGTTAQAGTLSTARSAVARAVNARALARPSYANFDIVQIDPAADPEAAAAALAARPEVEYAQASYRVYPYAQPNDPLFNIQWNLQQLEMARAWDINPGATDAVVVAVIDTGVAFRAGIVEFDTVPYEGLPSLGRVTVPFAAAPDLATPGRFVAPRDFIYDDDAPFDTDGHGTHVAGTIGQLTNNSLSVAGMAYNVRLMPIKAITGDWDDIFDSPFVGTDDVIARAIRYAADNGARVINLSIGRTGGGPATVVGDAMRYAVSRGAFITVSAGNDFERGNPIERIAEQAGPIDGAIVVAATDAAQNKSYFSGVHDYVEIAAPGGNARGDDWIYQQTYNPDFVETYLLPASQYRPPRFDVFATIGFQGTSMAAPHVAGLGALLYSQGITNPQAIEAAIKRFARDRGATGRDNEYGFGIINPRPTLRGLGVLR